MNTKRLIDIEFAKSDGYFVGWFKNDDLVCENKFAYLSKLFLSLLKMR
jgi:hypothetical protein